jgi:hypothetical protein
MQVWWVGHCQRAAAAADDDSVDENALLSLLLSLGLQQLVVHASADAHVSAKSPPLTASVWHGKGEPGHAMPKVAFDGAESAVLRSSATNPAMQPAQWFTKTVTDRA